MSAPRSEDLAALSEKQLRKRILEGLRTGRPTTGPLSVHVDLTNTCNARCVTCWDHSPLLETPRSPEWKGRRLPWTAFEALVDQLRAFGSVRHVVLSGMGEPLTHPDAVRMLRLCAAQGWRITLMTNLVAGDLDAVATSGVTQVLVGVQGATPDTHAAFHPGWNEQHFFKLCSGLRKLSRAGVRTRHVQVINRDTADELVEMVRFGKLFRADRVNFKLASLYAGTESCALTTEQRDRLIDEDLPAARALAETLGVATNLDLFDRQLRADRDQRGTTTDMAAIGCSMGHVYTRITVDQEVLYCCNTRVQVGSLTDATLPELWWGERWQQLRERLADGRFLPGCEVCGKVEQNATWARRRQETS